MIMQLPCPMIHSYSCGRTTVQLEYYIPVACISTTLGCYESFQLTTQAYRGCYMSGKGGRCAVAFLRHLCQSLCHAILLQQRERGWYGVTRHVGVTSRTSASYSTPSSLDTGLTTRLASTFSAFANLLAAVAASLHPFLPARFAGQSSLQFSSS